MSGDLLAAAVQRLAPSLPVFPAGHVWLAGAGPGDTRHLTLEVLGALAQADAVVYDALVDPAVLRAAPQAATHYVGKRAGEPSTPQADINALIVRLARGGARVLRLKGGDPNVFGRGGEEAQALAGAGIPFRFLPGLTAAFAALATTGIPATLRGTSKAITLATGHGAGDGDDELDWARLAATGQPIVVYMGLARLAAITAALIAGGRAPQTPVALIQSATLPGEKVLITDLAGAAEAAAAARLRTPALVVVGDIVRVRGAWQARLSAVQP